MKNAEKFRKIFREFATEVWAFPEKDFLTWLNAEYEEPTTKNETLVSLDVYKQVAKERDIAIQQLHELGYEFGQKIEPTTKNNLGVEEVTALAEWIEKLTKECEEAYNKGYADGVKSVNICPNCGEYIGEEE